MSAAEDPVQPLFPQAGPAQADAPPPCLPHAMNRGRWSGAPAPRRLALQPVRRPRVPLRGSEAPQLLIPPRWRATSKRARSNHRTRTRLEQRRARRRAHHVLCSLALSRGCAGPRRGCSSSHQMCACMQCCARVLCSFRGEPCATGDASGCKSSFLAPPLLASVLLDCCACRRTVSSAPCVAPPSQQYEISNDQNLCATKQGLALLNTNRVCSDSVESAKPGTGPPLVQPYDHFECSPCIASPTVSKGWKQG